MDINAVLVALEMMTLVREEFFSMIGEVLPALGLNIMYILAITYVHSW